MLEAISSRDGDDSGFMKIEAGLDLGGGCLAGDDVAIDGA